MEFNRPLFPVASSAPPQQPPRRRGPPIRQASIALARARLLDEAQGTPAQTQPQESEITTTTMPQVLPQTGQPVQEPKPQTPPPVQLRETLQPIISANAAASPRPPSPAQLETSTQKGTPQPATAINGTSPVQPVTVPLQPVQPAPVPIQLQPATAIRSTSPVQPVTVPLQPVQPAPVPLQLQPATAIRGTSPVQPVRVALQPVQPATVPLQLQPVPVPVPSSTMVQEKSQLEAIASSIRSPQPALPASLSGTTTNSSSSISSQVLEQTLKSATTTDGTTPSSAVQTQSAGKLQEASQPAIISDTTGYSQPKGTSQFATDITSSSLGPASFSAEKSPKLQEASKSEETTYAPGYSLPQSQALQQPLQSSVTTGAPSSSQPTPLPQKTSPKLQETSELATNTTTDVAPLPSASSEIYTQIQETLPMTANTTNFSTESTRLPTSPQPDSVPRAAITAKLPTSPESPKVIRSSSPTPPLSPRVDQPHIFTHLTSNPEPETQSPQPLPESKAVIMQGNANKNGTKAGNDNEKGEPTKNNHSSSNDAKPIVTQADMKVTSPQKKEKTAPSPNARSSNAAGVVAERKKENQLSFLTIAGQNLGASAEFGTPYHHHQQGRKQLHHTKAHESELSSKDTSSSERKTSSADHITRPIMSLVNSNVQTINNSILLNASCNQQNPGVHIKISRRRQQMMNKSK